MANNTLTARQDLLTREFFVTVAEQTEDLLPNSPASGRSLRGILLQLLNYDQLPNGAFVAKGTEITYKFGHADYSSYENEWESDYQRAIEELDNEGGNNTNTTETSTGESSTDTEVRQTILSEDVS